MDEEVRSKLFLDVEKIVRNFQSFDKLSAGDVKGSFVQLADLANRFVSTLLGREASVDADYFVLKDLLPEKAFMALCDAYFTVSSLAAKEFSKISRDAVRVKGWKNTELLDMKGSIAIARRLEKDIRSALECARRL